MKRGTLIEFVSRLKSNSIVHLVLVPRCRRLRCADGSFSRSIRDLTFCRGVVRCLKCSVRTEVSDWPNGRFRISPVANSTSRGHHSGLKHTRTHTHTQSHIVARYTWTRLSKMKLGVASCKFRNSCKSIGMSTDGAARRGGARRSASDCIRVF